MVNWWINRNALLLSLSAFFADMGYQAILAGFPILLVIVLHAPVYMLGIAYALTYGIGSIFGYLGGALGDRVGRKGMAILGNVFIPILSLTGLAASYPEAMATFSTGWWARDFRTPPRRAMLSEVTTSRIRGRAFGLLHAFDIGGGAIAVAYLIALLYLQWPLQRILLITAIPIGVSTLCLVFVNAGHRKKNRIANASDKRPAGTQTTVNKNAMLGVLIATALYGFSFYSLGFPILTIAQSSNSIYGIGSYLVYLAVSATAGYVIGIKLRKRSMVKGLSLLGYMLAAFGSLLLALFYLFHLSLFVSYAAVAAMGMALGAIETLEPTILSIIASRKSTSRTLGYLTSSRSIGLFSGNVIMGVLYIISPFYSYTYAFVGALSASVILLVLGRGFGSSPSTGSNPAAA